MSDVIHIRSPVYTATGAIDCEIEHPTLGWVPFTASPDDPEQHGRDIYEAALAMGPAPYVPPPEPPVMYPALTRRQLRLGLLHAGIPTSQVEDAIAAIPDPTDRGVAMIEWQDATIYERSHPLIDQIGSALGLTPEQIDAMWLAAAAL